MPGAHERDPANRAVGAQTTDVADQDEGGPVPRNEGTPEPILLPAGSGRVLDFLSITHRLTSDQSGCSIYIFEPAFEPGDGNRLHVHRREDEIAYVLEGALEVRLTDRTATLEAVA